MDAIQFNLLLNACSYCAGKATTSEKLSNLPRPAQLFKKERVLSGLGVTKTALASHIADAESFRRVP
ncbi:hypothetical protein H8959_007990, partial [Pygathrix nigripes]